MYMVGNFIGIPSPNIDGFKSLKYTKEFATIGIYKKELLRKICTKAYDTGSETATLVWLRKDAAVSNYYLVRCFPEFLCNRIGSHSCPTNSLSLET